MALDYRRAGAVGAGARTHRRDLAIGNEQVALLVEPRCGIEEARVLEERAQAVQARVRDDRLWSRYIRPMQLSRRVTSLKASSTVAVMNKAKALKAAGIDVLNFSAGEPDFQSPALR